MTNEKSEESQQDQFVSLNGFVVDYSLPSRTVLVDWIRKEVDEVRLKEVVELFPKEIFDELEAIRRLFYYKLVALTVPAYTLKILPFDALAKFQGAIEQAKKRLKALDVMIVKAIETTYSKKARSYYQEAGNGKPRIVNNISHRFTVSVMPLQIDRFVWREFLDESLEKQLDAIHRKYDARKQELKEEIEGIQAKIFVAQADLKRSKQDVAKAYEGLTVPMDLATMKIEWKELKGQINDLKYSIQKLKQQINRLELKKSRDVASFERSSRWVRSQTEETEKRITFDTKKLYQDQLEKMVRDALNLLPRRKGIRNKGLKGRIRMALDSRNRVVSLMPTSRLGNLFEKVIIAMKEALNGNLEAAKKQLEEMY